MKIESGSTVMKRFLVVCQFVLLCLFAGYASAEIVDDITLDTKPGGEVEAIIRFSVPVQYSRHFPLRKSADLAIYFNILGSVPRNEWQNYESHRSPASDIVRGFTVTTRDLNTGPKIEVQFSHPVEFAVGAGPDDRSIVLRIKPPVVRKKEEPATASAPAAAVSIMPPAHVVAAEKVAPAAISPPASAPVVPKTTVIPQSAPQLGGSDGLPLFPMIDQLPPQSASQPAGTVTLADQIRKANSQAALSMVKGRDAILAGQMAAAIEAFNEVLKLPPNRYSSAAQVWIGIAREKSGQQAKARLEYELYLKLYPDGTDAVWVKARLAKLNAIQPVPVTVPQVSVAPKAQPSEFQTAAYGSVSMYYYHGASQTTTVATVGTVQTPTTLSLTDQSSLITNVSLTARSYNNEFDNRLVFQDFNSKSFLQNQPNQNRLNAAYYDVRNRVDNYSARIGRQSAMGGGVLGRFDGVSAGYGFRPDWRANIITGQLSDKTLDAKPVFVSVGLDFGVNSPLGGSVYFINQKAQGLTDRKAVGGNMRYFEQGKTALAMLDYDLQFQAINILTLQGTLNYDSGIDYNFLFDRRRTPVFDIRNAVNGTTATIDTLLQNGWTIDDLMMLAKARTAVSTVALVGVTQRVREKLQVGVDLSVSNTSSLQASGTLNPDGTTGVEGFVAATPSTGNAWTLTGRVSGNDVLSARDISLCSLSYSSSQQAKSETLLLYNHAYPRELWTVDSTLRLFWQSDNTGGKTDTIGPVFKAGYRLRTSLTVEAEGGVDWSTSTPASMPSSKTTRKYFSFGFRWDL